MLLCLVGVSVKTTNFPGKVTEAMQCHAMSLGLGASARNPSHNGDVLCCAVLWASRACARFKSGRGEGFDVRGNFIMIIVVILIIISLLREA